MKYTFVFLFAGVFLFGCDMANRIKFEPLVIHPSAKPMALKEITFDNLKNAISPVIERNGLSCEEQQQRNKRILKCETWALSSTGLILVNDSGEIALTVYDNFVFIWTPQPFGRISSEVKQVMISEFGTSAVSCKIGLYDFPCDQWENEGE